MWGPCHCGYSTSGYQHGWAFLVAVFATAPLQPAQTRATKAVRRQNCCQGFCQHSDVSRERHFLDNTAVTAKLCAVSLSQRWAENWSHISSDKGGQEELQLLTG